MPNLLFSPGMIINELYKVIDEAGRGGFGTVLKVQSLENEAMLALKYVTGHGEDQERFRREIRALEKFVDLNIPGVVPILDFELRHNPPYYVMPFAESSLEKEGPRLQRDEKALLAAFESICRTLSAVHLAGYIHRDLKPANILLIDGKFAVADFGLVRNEYSESATLTQANMGTPEWCAPEQRVTAGMREADARTDIYQLGKILYWLLTGRSPSHFDLEDIRHGLKQIVRKATEFEKENRFPDVQSLLTTLEMYVAISSHAGQNLVIAGDNFGSAGAKTTSLSADGAAAVAVEFIQNGKPNANIKVRKYWDKLEQEIKSLAPDLTRGPDDEAFVRALDRTIGLNIHFSRVADAVAEMQDGTAATSLYKGFERMIREYSLPRGVGGSFSNYGFDFYKFVSQELFVTLFVPVLRYERWEMIRTLLETKLDVDNHPSSNSIAIGYNCICEYLHILQNRKSRLKLNQTCLHSDLLKERHTQGSLATEIPFDEFMEADFLLHLRTLTHVTDDMEPWLPWSSLYLNGPPKFLLRSVDKEYARNLMTAFSIPNLDRLRNAVLLARGKDYFRQGPFRIPLSRFVPQSIGTE